MQLKPGRHGSDSDVHSLMSAEVGMGDREPGTAPPQPQHLGPGLHWGRPVLGSRSAQVRNGVRLFHGTKGSNFQNPSTCQLLSNRAARAGGGGKQG